MAHEAYIILKAETLPVIAGRWIGQYWCKTSRRSGRIWRQSVAIGDTCPITARRPR